MATQPEPTTSYVTGVAASPDWETWDPLSHQDRRGTIVRQAVIVLILIISSLFQAYIAFQGLDNLDAGFRRSQELQNRLSLPALELQIKMREAHYQLYKASRHLADGLSLEDVTSLLDRSREAAIESRKIFDGINHSRTLLPEGQAILDYLEQRLPGFEQRIMDAITQLQTQPAYAILTLQTADTEFGALRNALETLNMRCQTQGAMALEESKVMRTSIAEQMGLASVVTLALVTGLVLLSVRFLFQPLKDMVRRNARHMEALIHNVDRLERLSSLSMLVTGLSHEMNTPLGNCITLSSFLKNNLGLFSDPSRQEELITALDILQQSLNRASGLVQTFKMAGAAQNCGERRVFTLDHLLAELHQDFAPSFSKRGIRLSFPDIDCTDELDTYFDSLKLCLTKILQNCIDHAFPETGKQCAVQPAVCVSLRDHDKNILYIDIADNGAGMDDLVRQDVFKPFHTLRHRDGALGLGLYIAQTHATGVLGGNIVLEALDPGTRVILAISRSIH